MENNQEINSGSHSELHPTSISELDGLLKKYDSEIVSDEKGTAEDRKERLLRSLDSGEARLIVDPESATDKLVREAQVATAQIIFTNSKGERFRLVEGPRHTLPQNSTYEEYKAGKVQPTKTEPRNNEVSISETIHAFDHPRVQTETTRQGIVRGISEEAFETALKYSGRKSDIETCKEFLDAKVQATQFEINWRKKDDDKNSLKGLRSKIEDYRFVLEISEQDLAKYPIPIELDDQGVPQTLEEFVDRSERGKDNSLNEFHWQELKTEEEYQVLTERKNTYINEEERTTGSRAVLRKLIERDNVMGISSYRARLEILALDDGTTKNDEGEPAWLESWEAFVTDPILIGKTYNEVKEDLFNNYDASWIPERKLMHREIFDKEKLKVRELSERLSKLEIIKHRPTVIIMRGNTASGKTTFLKTSEIFKGAMKIDPDTMTIDPDTGEIDKNSGQIEGVINPDTYKGYILKELIQNTSHGVLGDQVRTEGNVLRDRMETVAFEAELVVSMLEKFGQAKISFVLDRRFGAIRELFGSDDSPGVVDKGLASNHAVIIIDLEVPLLASLLRVLGRKPEDLCSPRLPYKAIADGYIEIRRDRSFIIKQVKMLNNQGYQISRIPYLFVDNALLSFDEMSDEQYADMGAPANTEELRREASSIGSQKVIELIELYPGNVYLKEYAKDDLDLKDALDRHSKKKI